MSATTKAKTPAAVTPAATPDTLKAVMLEFLGTEFLTWLYFHIVVEGGAIDFGEAIPEEMRPNPDDEGRRDVLFSIGRKISLASVDAGGARLTLTGAGLDDSGEVIQAVRRGAFITTMSINFSLGHRVYAVTLDSVGTIVGLKLPDLFSEPEPESAEPVDPLAPKKRPRRAKLPIEDVLQLRQQCCDEVEAVVDALLASFIEKRISRKWVTHDVAVIRDVVSTGLKARLVASTKP